jgi:putative ABC transport system substrate-binding protein
MNNRRKVVIALGAAWLCVPLASLAQQKPVKVYRVGILFAGSSNPRGLGQSLRAEMGGLGYVEGKNLVIEERFAEGKYDRLPQLAADLVGLKVDVLVASGTPATLAAKNATSTIPIVMAGVGDAVASGLISSLARPGGNITGMTIYSPELVAKRLELIKEALPHIRRVAAILNPVNPAQERSWQAIETAARALKVEVSKYELRAAQEFETAFASMARDRIDALVLPVDTLFTASSRALADLAAKYRLPAIGPSQMSETGLLMSYGVLLSQTNRRIAYFVDRIVKGTKPADLPVELPTRFEFVVNLRTAKTLGITLPAAILARADRVIE